MQKYVLVVVAAALLLRGAPAMAQVEAGPDPASVRVHIGPLMMNPSISINNIGVDHNVFNDPPDKNPKQDFTATVTPMADFWIHLGPTWLTSSLYESINWYQEYATERTANTTYKLGWRVPDSQIAFKIEGAYINAHERPGFEIDTRAGRQETLFNGALDFHALSKSFIGVSASRQQIQFADDAEYLGTSLSTALNRVDTTVAANFRHQLTPLTTVTLTASHSLARFEFSPERDTNSTAAHLSMAFSPDALLRGGFSIGYDDFAPVDLLLPGFRGLIGTVDLTYVLLGSTRFAMSGSRGVQYSFDQVQPYYVQSRIGGSVAQQIFGPIDVQVRGDVAHLAYRDRAGVDVKVPDRTDRVVTYGIGVGLHMGQDLRLSFNVDQSNRDTQVLEHQYERLLVGASLTYGF